LRAVEEVVAVEPGPWVVSTSAESLIRVATAIRERRRLVFDYQTRAGAASQRAIEPYGVIHMDGRWYVAGYCLLRKALRTFRLDRVAEPELGEERFEPPTDFDIKKHMGQGMPFVQSKYAVDVWIDLPIAEAQSRLAFYRVATWEEDGGTRVQCGREVLDWFAAMLLSLGCRIVVREPGELRETFKLLAERARAAYAG
jgi:predicted DNA-binding transcriptional regulator YafY